MPRRERDRGRPAPMTEQDEHLINALIALNSLRTRLRCQK
jgi:hypothetical protein